jgi:hypothetical protein
VRRRIQILSALLGASVLGLLAWSLIPTSPVTRANYDTLKLNSTRAEVEAVLGPPTTSDEFQEAMTELLLTVLLQPQKDGDIDRVFPAEKGQVGRAAYHLGWVGNVNIVEAEFDAADRVTYLRLAVIRRPSFFSKVRESIRNCTGF